MTKITFLMLRFDTPVDQLHSSASGHERQRQAPARWPATLLRGGVLRVTTRLRAIPRSKHGPTPAPVREGSVVSVAHHDPVVAPRQHCLVLLAMHVLAVADVDCR